MSAAARAEEALLRIKPHHFLDMIKLYGAGYESFVPDETTGHAFYSVGNQILRDPRTKLRFTFACDDVCGPCKWRQGTLCTDAVSGLGAYRGKDAYNKMLDERLARLAGLKLDRIYTAEETCALLARHREAIFEVWSLEERARLEKRYELFCKGCEKYLARCEAAEEHAGALAAQDEEAAR